MNRTPLTVLFTIFLISLVTTEDDFQSPCPRLFAYETESVQDGKWFGILTMLSNTDSKGTWVKLEFDRPVLELGNWYGNVLAFNSKIYIIANLEDDLKAHVPKTIRFYITYDPVEPLPKLVSFRVNEKRICPEERITGTTTVALVLKTGRYMPKNKMKPPPPANLTAIIKEIDTREGIPELNYSEEDEFFTSDLYAFLKPQNTINKPRGDDIPCGTVVTRPRPLITYGQPTQEGEFPWHAAIYHIKITDVAYICGASLISKNFVITVAHCVTKPKTSIPQRAEKFIVYLGKHYLNQFSNAGIQDRQISDIIIYPGYDAHNLSKDLALLKLSHPAEYNDYVRPICLWQESIDLDRIVNKQGNVVGWGFDETGKVTEQLMQAGMPVVSRETCLFSFPDFYTRFATENTYCAGFRNGTSVCNGDSGGGMFFPKSNSNPKNPVWQLRGLVSVSAALRNNFKCDASNYVIFTDLAKYSNWIKDTIK